MIVTDHAVGYWVFERLEGTYLPNDSVAIGRVEHGKIIGGVVFNNYNKKSIQMHCAGERNWLSRQYLYALFHYPFIQLKVKRVFGLVDEANEAAKKLDEHLGFKQIAKIPDAAAKGDLLVYSMTIDQCRFLGRNYQKVREAA